MKLVVLVFSFLTLVLFAFYLLWRREKNKLPVIIDRKFIGLRRDVICCDVVLHYDRPVEYCALCDREIRLRKDRYVHYGNRDKLCYLCWKRENFVNITERILIFSKELNEDVQSVIRRYMLDDYWENCSYDRDFPYSMKNLMSLVYRKLPTLDLPFHVRIDSNVLRWPLVGKHWVCLSICPDDHVLGIYNEKTMQPYFTEQRRKNDEPSVRETFLLIHKIQMMTLKEVEGLNIFQKY